MIFPYLSLTAPEIQGNHQMSGSLPDPWAVLPLRGSQSGSLPDPWAVLPLRGSHRAVFQRKSHYAVMPHGHTPNAVRCLQTGFRSCPKDRHGVRR